ncbi:hypothetical protein HZ326_15001 [Fusarium oxysporum f. sp. albedinis]|nr:hypothetical protein HZ326_15001 [Fusarium oxysporum f. sp. albedinis]
MSGLFLASVSRLSTESASSRLSGEIGLEAHDEFSCSIIPLIKNDSMFDHQHRENKGNHKDANDKQTLHSPELICALDHDICSEHHKCNTMTTPLASELESGSLSSLLHRVCVVSRK